VSIRRNAAAPSRYSVASRAHREAAPWFPACCARRAFEPCIPAVNSSVRMQASKLIFSSCSFLAAGRTLANAMDDDVTDLSRRIEALENVAHSLRARGGHVSIEERVLVLEDRLRQLERSLGRCEGRMEELRAFCLDAFRPTTAPTAPPPEPPG
jgi:hypothetical protein